MSLDYSITHEQSRVEIHVRGQGDYLSTDQMWKDIAEAKRWLAERPGGD